MQINIFRSKSK